MTRIYKNENKKSSSSRREAEKCMYDLVENRMWSLKKLIDSKVAGPVGFDPTTSGCLQFLEGRRSIHAELRAHVY